MRLRGGKLAIVEAGSNDLVYIDRASLIEINRIHARREQRVSKGNMVLINSKRSYYSISTDTIVWISGQTTMSLITSASISPKVANLEPLHFLSKEQKSSNAPPYILQGVISSSNSLFLISVYGGTFFISYTDALQNSEDYLLSDRCNKCRYIFNRSEIRYRYGAHSK